LKRTANVGIIGKGKAYEQGLQRAPAEREHAGENS